MFRRLAALALSAFLALPAAAFDITAMSEAEREAFGDAVREYLLSNPLVLREAIEALQVAEAAEAAATDEVLVAANAGAIFEDDHSYVGGNPEGDVTLVEFIDYRCGYCRRAHPEVTELVKSDGEIRKIIKEFPILGPDSVEASRFAIAAKLVEGDEAYAQVNETLIAHEGSFARPALGRIANDLGLDGEAIIARMDDDAVTEVIRANHELAAALQISGTPTFVLGDTMLRGYVPLEGMREVVAEVRAD